MWLCTDTDEERDLIDLAKLDGVVRAILAEVASGHDHALTTVDGGQEYKEEGGGRV